MGRIQAMGMTGPQAGVVLGREGEPSGILHRGGSKTAKGWMCGGVTFGGIEAGLRPREMAEASHACASIPFRGSF
jgi:hypothetical protein